MSVEKTLFIDFHGEKELQIHKEAANLIRFSGIWVTTPHANSVNEGFFKNSSIAFSEISVPITGVVPLSR